MEISGETRVCGLIGYPVRHSLSPVMHNAAFKELNLPFIYVVFEVKKDELKDAIAGVRGLGIHGLNVTMPHKSAVMKYLDEIDPIAEGIGAVNTILNEEGKLKGYNTDSLGALKALEENGVELEGRKLLLIGAGGAGKAIAFQLAQKVEELIILNRTVEKAKVLAETLRERFGKRVVGEPLSEKFLKERLKQVDILINATSIGMHPNVEESPVNPRWLRSDLTVMDIVYNPLETKLLREARAVGAKTINGIEMLIHQGAASFEIWTRHKAPIEVMRKAILEKISRGLGAPS